MSDKKTSKRKQKVAPSKMVRVKSNLRRPVSFRIPGKTMRLAPGESIEIPATALETSELRSLRRQQAVLVPSATGEAGANGPDKAHKQDKFAKEGSADEGKKAGTETVTDKKTTKSAKAGSKK